MIKVGEVAFIKTTSEAVFVLNEATNNRPSTPSFKTTVLVRRPTAGQDGIVHKEEIFYTEELETLDEQRKRFMSERKDVIEKFTSAVPSDDPQSFLA